MDAFDAYLNNMVSQTKKAFQEFPEINWLNPYRDEKLIELRKSLLEETKNSQLFKGTKLYYNQLSKGCKLCGLGTWSCLFITNKCNASCFYCPASQQNDEVPATQNLTFETAEAYADYIKGTSKNCFFLKPLFIENFFRLIHFSMFSWRLFN